MESQDLNLLVEAVKQFQTEQIQIGELTGIKLNKDAPIRKEKILLDDLEKKLARASKAKAKLKKEKVKLKKEKEALQKKIEELEAENLELKKNYNERFDLLDL